MCHFFISSIIFGAQIFASCVVTLKLKSEGNNVIADFICPTPAARKLFPADYIVWVDTIKAGRFNDTNQMFVKPDKYNYHVTSQDAKTWAPKILKDLKI